MLDKYHKIQTLISDQKKRKDRILEIFEEVFNKQLELPEIIKIEVDFKSDGLVCVVVKDKSSVRFVVNKHKQKVIELFQKDYPQNILVIK